MSTPSSPPHPVLACLDAVEEAVKDVAGVDPAFMRPGEKGDALRRLVQLEARLSGLRFRVMSASGELAEATADRSVATWLAVESRTEVRAQTADLSLARSLERQWVRLGEALGQGAVNLPQARVIASALDDLPASEVGPEVMAKAEDALIGYAAHHPPRALRRLGRRILEVAAPDESDALEAQAVEREERRAAAVTALSLHPLGDGTTRIAGRVADSVAERLRTYLDAFTSPRHLSAGGVSGSRGDEGPRNPRQRLGEAFGAFLEAADPGRMPLHGGDATTLIVTIDHDVLAGRLAGVGLVGDEPISAGQVRRLACGAAILPAVLGGKSEVLDLGRASRLYRPPQRKAMAVRDRRCRSEGCTIPAARCEAHHAGDPWSRGGRTDLAEGALLCSWHHHRAHDDRYLVERLPNGDFRFHRRM
ncbi:MAG: DUF222 domain-containing protein [Nocardioides sp.]